MAGKEFPSIRKIADNGTISEAYALVIANELWHVLNWAHDNETMGLESSYWSDIIARELFN